MKKFGLLILLLCAFFAKTEHFSSSSNLQVTYGVEENQLILKSIDSTVSNFGDEEDKKLYKRCIQHYLEFQGLHTAGNYASAYVRVRHTQKLLILLYERMLSKNITKVRLELNRLGRNARGKEKTQTNAFLRLGLRDLAEAEQKLIFAKNTRPYLYLLKLREMLFSLKILKHSGKFVVFLALLHDADFPVELESVDFQTINDEILRSMTENKDLFLTFHWDNHFKTLIGDGVYTQTMHTPDMEELAKPMGDLDPAYVRLSLDPRKKVK
ncbi:adhesin OmpL37 family surface protein [Leptospira idonii]|uniref:adhesin OmpL37 family surface protein n=1 Tax=Leptospira idonii TaxID=1193500 RepID=UPI001AEF3F0D|nr:hypothetical protein [Leptospira idonii]